MKKSICKNCIYWKQDKTEKGIGICTKAKSKTELSGFEDKPSCSIIIRPALPERYKIFFSGGFGCPKFKTK